MIWVDRVPDVVAEATRPVSASERFASAEERRQWYDRNYLNPRVFDPRYYLQHNPDVNAACEGNLTCAENHWLLNGIKECRNGHPAIHPRWYLDTYGDLRGTSYDSCEGALVHFMDHGDRPGAP